jgi:hypothetical protein
MASVTRPERVWPYSAPSLQRLASVIYYYNNGAHTPPVVSCRVTEFESWGGRGEGAKILLQIFVLQYLRRELLQCRILE